MAEAVDELLSERLFAALVAEVGALEKRPKTRRTKPGEDGTKAVLPDPALGAKARVEAISQLTRTLEKLLELKRLEALARHTDATEDDAEATRLRAEMLKRLKAMDARRSEGRDPFAPSRGDER